MAACLVELICPQCAASFRANPGAIVSCPVCSFRGGRVPGVAATPSFQPAQGAYTPSLPGQAKVPGTDDEGVETNRSAVAALVLGLCFFVPPAGLFALMFGVIAVGQIREAKGRDDRPDQKGRGMAIAGIVLGAIFQLAWFIFIIGLLAFGASNLDAILGR